MALPQGIGYGLFQVTIDRHSPTFHIVVHTVRASLFLIFIRIRQSMQLSVPTSLPTAMGPRNAEGKRAAEAGGAAPVEEITNVEVVVEDSEAATLAKLAKIQRLHSPVVSAAAGTETALPDLPKFPPIVPGITGAGSGSASGQDPILAAIAALSTKIDSMSLKTDLVETKIGEMASKQDL